MTKHNLKRGLLYVYFFILCMNSFSQEFKDDFSPLIQNSQKRTVQVLDGNWQYIIDWAKTGLYGTDGQQKLPGFFENRQIEDPYKLQEYDFKTSPRIRVPGDWNTQDDKLLYYEGTIWYQRDFKYKKQENKRVFLYFNSANYEAIVGVNGQVVGSHIGGFTPFNFEITDELNGEDNFVVVSVNNERKIENVPSNNFDWWNFGGITGSVYLIETEKTFIRDYSIHLSDLNNREISGWVQLDGNLDGNNIIVELPELNKRIDVKPNNEGVAHFNFKAKNIEFWEPDNAKLYKLIISYGNDTVEDEVGFRTISVSGKDVLLNGEPVFLRGVNIHEEAPFGGSKVSHLNQVKTLLDWAQEMNCNFVRLSHYPHSENMIREAEKRGLLIWEELPLYWAMDWDNENTYKNAEMQLVEMISRDKNRAGIILWSMSNETIPDNEVRLNFIKRLIKKTRQLDDSRLITSAVMASDWRQNNWILDDSLGEYLDLIGLNIYPGWYGDFMSEPFVLSSLYDNKPLIMSEFGSGAITGYYGSSEIRWTEEFQERVIEKNLDLYEQIPNLRGLSPWVLKDFRSPKRLLPGVQDSWNRKGLVGDNGMKKKAFYTIQSYYEKIKKKK